MGADPGHLHIGLLTHDPFLGLPIAPECLAAVAATAHLLAFLGHDVEEASPPALSGPTGLGLGAPHHQCQRNCGASRCVERADRAEDYG